VSGRRAVGRAPRQVGLAVGLSKHVLSLDVGSSQLRARIYDERAEVVADAGNEQHGGVEGADPDAIVAVVRSALERVQRGAPSVVGAAVSSFGHSLLLLDERGRPLSKIVGWRDIGAADAADRLAAELGDAAVHARTGCHLHPSYWPAKLARLREAEPELFARARFVSFADYLYGQLLGEEAPESLSLASGTGLLNVRTLRWDEELLGALGVEAERLPRLGAEPVDGWFPALLDGACSNLGSGCVGRTRAALMVGTSGALRTLYETDDPRPRPGLFLYRVDERRVLDGGALSDGGNVFKWLNDTLAEAEGSVAERPPDAHGLTFLTLLGGERSPGWNAHRTGAVAGLTFRTTALDLRQAALEGVGCRFADVLDLMPEVGEIVATGGAMRGRPDWVQLIADVLGRPVVLSGVDEGSARGAAVDALQRLGVEAPPAPLGPVFEPRTDRAEAYRSLRERQRRLYLGVS
jgi:gluconokinase